MTTTRTTITIDEDLLTEVKTQAAGSGRTVSELVSDALRQMLLQRREAERADRGPLPTSGHGGLQPGVNLDSSADLRDYLDSLGEKSWP